MATVTGYTAARMKEIEDGTVVSGAVVAGHLILTKFDGTEIDAGSVVGPEGPDGPAGPGATTLSELTDVDTTGAVEGQVLLHDGTGWVPGSNGTKVTASDTAPVSPSVGDLWVDSSS